VGYAFCQHCGAKMTQTPVGAAPAPAARPSASPGMGVADTLAASDSAAAQALMAARAQALAPRQAPPPAPAQSPPPVAGVIGSGAAVRSAPGPVPPQAAFPPTLPSAGPLAEAVASAAASFGRLVSVHRDGRDGTAFPLSGDHALVGRSEGDITFAQDRFLAPRHARVERRGNAVWVRPLDRTNGVYIKVTGEHPVADGDYLLLGKEVFRFEVVDKAERDVQPSAQHGTWIFASPPRAPWGRLVQIIVTGAARDIYHLNRPEVTVGREEGDLRFPDDEFMSRRHAMISQHDGHPHLQDLGSSNGSYIRLRGEHELEPGDLIRMGDQLFRFEPA